MLNEASNYKFQVYLREWYSPSLSIVQWSKIQKEKLLIIWYMMNSKSFKIWKLPFQSASPFGPWIAEPVKEIKRKKKHFSTYILKFKSF